MVCSYIILNSSLQWDFSGVADPQAGRKRMLSLLLDETRTHHYQADVVDSLRQQYFEALDTIVNGIKSRFDQVGARVYAEMEQMLLKGDVGNNTLLSSYPELSVSGLQTEFLIYKASSPEASSLRNVREYVDKFKADSTNLIQFPNIATLCKLLLIVPASNASSERSFSAMKRLKTPMRNAMGHARLSFLMGLYVHRGITDSLDMSLIIKEFIMCHQHRVKQIAMI